MNIILTFNKFCPLNFKIKNVQNILHSNDFFINCFILLFLFFYTYFYFVRNFFFFILSVNIRKHHEISCLIYSDQINRLFNRQSVVENFHEHEIRKI